MPRSSIPFVAAASDIDTLKVGVSGYERQATPANIRSITGGQGVFIGHYGATGSGNETTEFQAAIDALPAAGGVISLEDGVDYTITTASLNVGSKSVFWTGNSTINGGSNLSSLPSVSISYHNAAEQVLYNHNDDNAELNPVVRVRRDASYTSTGTSNGIAFKIDHTVDATGNHYEFAQIIDFDTDATDDTVEQGGLYVRAVKNASAEAKLWGIAYSVINRSTVDASIVGAEFNCRALGDHTDAGDSRFGTGNRYNLDVIMSTADDLAATDRATFDAGINVIANGGVRAATVDVGVLFQDETDGIITTAIKMDLGNAVTGIQIGGTYTGDAIDITGACVYGVDFASGTYSAGAIRVGSDNQMRMDDAGNSRIVYDGTDTRLEVRWGATELASFENASDAIRLRVNGSLKQVTEGATDSGGTGFKVLRVPN